MNKPTAWRTIPDGVIPDVNAIVAWANANQRHLLYHTNSRTFLVVLWFDDGEVNVYGDVSEAARTWWDIVQHNGKTLSARLDEAERRVRDMESGVGAAFRFSFETELRSRVTDLKAALARGSDGNGPGDPVFDLTNVADVERLINKLSSRALVF